MSKKYSGKKFDDLSDWRLFIKLCSQQSLSAVANATGLDSSTISRRISSLEERLGTKLFYRSSQKTSPTADAMRYREKIQKILQQYDSVVTGKLNDAGKIEDTVTICASPCFHQFVISRWALLFNRLHPGVRIKLIMTQDALHPTSSGLDIAIHSGPYIRMLDDVPWVELGQLTSSIAASPQYIQSHGTPQEPEDLSEHVLMHYSGRMSGGTYRLIGPDGQVNSYDFVPALESSSTTGLIRPAIDGLGVLLYACDFMLKEEFQNGKLVKVLPDWKQPLTHVCAVLNPDSLKRYAVKEFLAFMLDQWTEVPGFVRTGPMPKVPD